MRGMFLIVLSLSLLSVGARSEEDQYVTGRDRIMCATQQSLREAMTAIQTKNRDMMHTVQGCHYTIEGVHVEIVQDNVSMLKIRLGDPGQQNRDEFWTLPDSIRLVNRR